jgi:hypothetical protein
MNRESTPVSITQTGNEKIDLSELTPGEFSDTETTNGSNQTRYDNEQIDNSRFNQDTSDKNYGGSNGAG